jgi:hypothetical protein
MKQDRHQKSEGGVEPIERIKAMAQNGASSYTRVVATVILVVAVPMLLLSSSALALFYIAPNRFEGILARLPFEAAIRTVLIFAPVTLLAIIVLAVLYAFEKPSVEVTRPQVVRAVEPEGEPITLSLQRVGWWVMWVAFAGLLMLIPIRAAAFLSPTHFENFLARLPGDRWLDFLIHTGPFLLLLVEFFAVTLFLGARIKPSGRDEEVVLPVMKWLRKIGPTRLTVGVVLTSGLPILILSLMALILFFTRTEDLLGLLSGLPGEVPLRMGLIFIPTSLTIVITLAVLFLIRRGIESESAFNFVLGDQLSLELVLWYLSWFLSWAVALANVTILGLVVGVIVLILR